MRGAHPLFDSTQIVLFVVATMMGLGMLLVFPLVVFGPPASLPERVLVEPFDSYGTVLARKDGRVLVRVEAWVHETDLWKPAAELSSEEQEHEDFCGGHAQ